MSKRIAKYWYFDADAAERGNLFDAVYQSVLGDFDDFEPGSATELEAIDRLKVELRARHRQRMRAVRYLLKSAKERAR